MNQRRLAVLTRQVIAGVPRRNRYGAVIYEPFGRLTVPTALTQLFRNGEIWGVSREMVMNYYGQPAVAMVNVQNIFGSGFESFIETAINNLKLKLPFVIELGAVGLQDLRLSLPQGSRQWDSKLEPELIFRRVLNDAAKSTQEALVQEFVKHFYDLAGVET